MMRNLISISRQFFLPTSSFCLRNTSQEIKISAASCIQSYNYCKDHSINIKESSHSSNNSSNKSATTSQPTEIKIEEKKEQSQNEDNRQEREHFEEDPEGELQDNILNAALSFVPSYGWTTDSLAKGAESLGYSSMVHGMFENGPTDLVNFFHRNCNSKLEEELKNLAKEREESKEKSSTTKFLKHSIETRLRMNIDYIDSWPQAIALHMSPTNVPNALDNIGNLMDCIWYHAGDRSSDFNWYTKRVILGGVYKSTELCMLQDKSQDFQETWSFLDRRLTEVVTAAKCIRQATVTGKDLGKVGQAGLITALNILGLNSKSRR